MNKLIVIVGPTGSGKTELSLHLAKRVPVAIVNGDSRQVFRGMDIGTGKPTQGQRALVPHHLFDVVDPDQEFHVALYQRLATAAIGRIQKQGRLPVLVGGSGQYIWSVVEGWMVPQVAPDPAFRRRLEKEAHMQGAGRLHSELAQVDPEAARRIQATNIRRIIRALELHHRSGQRPSSVLWRRRPPHWQMLIVGLTLPRAELYQRTDSRIDRMVATGLVEEVARLLWKGYQLDLPSLSSIGYKQIGQYLHGEISLPQAMQEAKVQTHRMARHQYTWFRPRDPRILWFCAADSAALERAIRLCASFAQDPTATGRTIHEKGETAP